MNNPAVISGQLVDVRNIATEKSIRLSIHVPAELAAAVIESFGWPTQVSPVPVAIARLVEGKEGDATGKDSPKFSNVTPETRPRVASEQPRGAKSWHEMSAAQQAGILCSDPKFRTYLAEIEDLKAPAVDEEMAAELVRRICRVETRADIDKSETTKTRWHRIVGDFRAWEAAPRAGV